MPFGTKTGSSPEFFLSRGSYPDDIKLENVVRHFDSDQVGVLQEQWGSTKDKDKGTPCWTINKMVMHLTSQRVRGYNYRNLRTELVPTVQKLIAALRAEMGRRR